MCLCYGAVSVCLSFTSLHAGIASKRLNWSSWFSAHRIPSMYSSFCSNKILIAHLQKQVYVHMEPCFKLCTFSRFFCSLILRGKKTVASVTDLVWPSKVNYHWTSALVCNMPGALRLRQLKLLLTRMWANAQPDGRPAEHRWRPLFNIAKFGWRPLLDAVQ